MKDKIDHSITQLYREALGEDVQNWLSEKDVSFLNSLEKVIAFETPIKFLNMEQLKELLAERWESIKQTPSSYLNDPYSTINKLCISLCKLAIEQDNLNSQTKQQNFSSWLMEGGKHYPFLMPGIEWKSYMDVDEGDCYYQNQPLFNLSLFDNGKDLIGCKDAVGSSELDENNSLQMKHEQQGQEIEVSLSLDEKARVYFKSSALQVSPGVSQEGKEFISALKSCFRNMRAHDKYHQRGKTEEQAEYTTTETAEQHRLKFWEDVYKKYYDNEDVRNKLSQIKVIGIVAGNLGYSNLADMLDIYTTGCKKGSDKIFTRCLDTLASSIEDIINRNMDKLRACFPEDENVVKSKFTRVLPIWKKNTLHRIDNAVRSPRSLYSDLHQQLERMQSLIKSDLPPSAKFAAQNAFNQLKECTMDFYAQPMTNKSIVDFQTTFTQALKGADEPLAKHSARWKPILANILIALTVIGLVAIGIKTKRAYNGAVQGKNDFNINNCLFFAKTKSEIIAEKTKDTVMGFNRLGGKND